jgi:DNA end-binding protein Ku
LSALLPGQKALSLEVMRPFEELRDPSDLPVPSSIKKSAEVKMARMLIDQMSTEEWDPTQHPNEYRKALQKLLTSKRTFALKKGEEPEETGKVLDLMEALRRSVRQAPKTAAKKAASRRAGAA